MIISKISPSLAILIASIMSLLLISACGGSSSDPSTQKPTINPPKDPCLADDTIKGCKGYIVVPPNPFLENVSANEPLKNYLIRPITLEPTAQATILPDSSEGSDISEVTYGTIDGLREADGSTTKTKYTTTSYGNFDPADNDGDKSDNDKINILEIKSGKTGAQPDYNYYYSHIAGKQFTQFLPAVNKLEILALASPSDQQSGDGNYIFRSGGGKAHFDAHKSFMTKVKDFTFKGFALVGFMSEKLYYIQEDELYPASFMLTFISADIKDFDEAMANNKFFSMKINLDGDAAVNTVATPKNVAITDANALKYATKTIELKNISFYEFDVGAAITYDLGGKQTGSFNLASLLSNFLAFSEVNDEIKQVAGSLFMNDDNDRSIRVTYASNEVCYSGPDGTADCPRVKLTGD